MVVQPQRQLHPSFSPKGGERILETAPNPGWWCVLVFLPWIPHLIDSYGLSALPRLLLPRDEPSDSTPECARVMFKSSSAPSSSAKESIVRGVGPGQGWLLYTEASPLASSKPEVPGSEEATSPMAQWDWWGLTASLRASSLALCF